MPDLTPNLTDARALLLETAERYHGELLNTGVTFAVYLVDGDNDHNLIVGGYPEDADVKVTPYEQRVGNLPDVKVFLDGRRWREMGHDEQVATLDRQLMRLELKHDKHGNVKTDKCNRPDVKRRAYDYRLQGFSLTASRHEGNSTEVREAKQVFADYRQSVFAWVDASDGEPIAGRVGGVREAV